MEEEAVEAEDEARKSGEGVGRVVAVFPVSEFINPRFFLAQRIISSSSSPCLWVTAARQCLWNSIKKSSCEEEASCTYLPRAISSVIPSSSL